MVSPLFYLFRIIKAYYGKHSIFKKVQIHDKQSLVALEIVMRYLTNAVHILSGCTLRTRERLVSKESMWCCVRGEVNHENL